jgi:hypothetical protein
MARASTPGQGEARRVDAGSNDEQHGSAVGAGTQSRLLPSAEQIERVRSWFPERDAFVRNGLLEMFAASPDKWVDGDRQRLGWLDFGRMLVAESRHSRRMEWEFSRMHRWNSMREMRHGSTAGRPVGGSPSQIVDSTKKAFYLVPGLLTAGINAVFGPQQNGKTSTVAAAVAAWSFGDSFAGYKPSAPLNVLWVSPEDPAGTSAHLVRHLGDRQSARYPTCWVVGKLPPLLRVEDESPQPNWLAEHRIREWCPWPPDLIVIDSWTALLAANRADEVVGAALVAEALRDVSAELGCGILVIAHSKKGDAGSDRGNALRDAADVMIPVRREVTLNGTSTFRWGLSDGEAAKWRHGKWPTSDLLLDFADDGTGWRCVGHRTATSCSTGTKKAKKSRGAEWRERVVAVLTAEPQRFKAIREAVTDDNGKQIPAATCSRALGDLVASGTAKLEESSGIKAWRLA